MFKPCYLYNRTMLRDFDKFQTLLPDKNNAHQLFNILMPANPIMSISEDQKVIEFHPEITNDIMTPQLLVEHLTKTDDLVFCEENQMSPADIEALNDYQIVTRNVPNDLYEVQSKPSFFEQHINDFPALEYYVISNREKYEKAWKTLKTIFQTFEHASFPSNPTLQTQILQMIEPAIRMNLAITTGKNSTGVTLFNYNPDLNVTDVPKDASITLTKRILDHQYVIERWTETIEKVTDRKKLQQHLRDLASFKDHTQKVPQLLEAEQMDLTFRYDDHCEMFHVVI